MYILIVGEENGFLWSFFAVDKVCLANYLMSLLVFYRHKEMVFDVDY